MFFHFIFVFFWSLLYWLLLEAGCQTRLCQWSLCSSKIYRYCTLVVQQGYSEIANLVIQKCHIVLLFLIWQVWIQTMSTMIILQYRMRNRALEANNIFLFIAFVPIIKILYVPSKYFIWVSFKQFFFPTKSTVSFKPYFFGENEYII